MRSKLWKKSKIKATEKILVDIWEIDNMSEADKMFEELGYEKSYQKSIYNKVWGILYKLSLETQEKFINIIRENIDEDTYTIKQKLKKYWKDEINYKPKEQDNWDISEFIDSKIQKRIEEGGSIFPID